MVVRKVAVFGSAIDTKSILFALSGSVLDPKILKIAK